MKEKIGKTIVKAISEVATGAAIFEARSVGRKRRRKKSFEQIIGGALEDFKDSHQPSEEFEGKGDKISRVLQVEFNGTSFGIDPDTNNWYFEELVKLGDRVPYYNRYESHGIRVHHSQISVSGEAVEASYEVNDEDLRRIGAKIKEVASKL